MGSVVVPDVSELDSRSPEQPSSGDLCGLGRGAPAPAGPRRLSMEGGARAWIRSEARRENRRGRTSAANTRVPQLRVPSRAS
jgi:hypothetical protein